MSARRWLALPLIAVVKAYQLVLSPLTPPSCRFYPSCSTYAVTALERFGPVRGTWLAVRRLLRCHPWNPGGVDHVPERGTAGSTAGASPTALPSLHLCSHRGPARRGTQHPT